MIISATSFVFHDSSIPVESVPTSVPWWLLLIVSVLAALVLALWLIRRRKQFVKKDDNRLQCFEKALDSLNQLDGNVSSKEFVMQCSWVLRSYVSKVTGDPLFYETHDEFMQRVSQLKLGSALLQEKLASICQWHSQFKYVSEASPLSQRQEMLERTREILSILHHHHSLA